MTKEKELELLRAKHRKDDRIFFTIIMGADLSAPRFYLN